MIGCRGSSPLTRGTRLRLESEARRLRFIPAYAGNSRGTEGVTKMAPVHPRLRGELCLISTGRRLLIGSSPLTRGTQEVKRLRAERLRFIPAYAGNSNTPINALPFRAVHPRLRGELVALIGVKSDYWRFIPAYAGNSLTFLTDWLKCSVHPRLRGELT